MKVAVEGEPIFHEEFEESTGWRRVGSKKSTRGQSLEPGADSQEGNNRKKQREQCLHQVTRLSWMTPLPRGDYKIIIRPRGGLRLADDGATRLGTSICHATKIPREAQDEDTICSNFQQNRIIVSTPIETHADRYQEISRIVAGDKTYDTSTYEAAPHRRYVKRHDT